jgi:hypothetical protein
MATITIPWADGNGNVILTYDGQGDGTVTVRSDTDNLGDTRQMTITLKTAGDNPATAQVTIIQPTGMQILLDVDGKTLRDADGKVLRAYPNEDVIPQND